MSTNTFSFQSKEFEINIRDNVVGYSIDILYGIRFDCSWSWNTAVDEQSSFDMRFKANVSILTVECCQLVQYFIIIIIKFLYYILHKERNLFNFRTKHTLKINEEHTTDYCYSYDEVSEKNKINQQQRKRIEKNVIDCNLQKYEFTHNFTSAYTNYRKHWCRSKRAR